jgi:hypothetical protein
MRFIKVSGHHPFFWALNVPIVGCAPWALLAWSWASWHALHRSGAGFRSLGIAARVAFAAISAVGVLLCSLLAWSAVRMIAYLLFS